LCRALRLREQRWGRRRISSNTVFTLTACTTHPTPNSKVEASNITPAAPHLSWTLPGPEAAALDGAAAAARGPLAALAALLDAALGYSADPHVALALLASAAACAAAAGGGDGCGGGGGGGAEGAPAAGQAPGGRAKAQVRG
jgi:hypothetical protein